MINRFIAQLKFYNSISLYFMRLTYCNLMHSAGVGRTGTFIALNILAKEAKDKNEVNPFECVKDLSV